MEDGKRLENLSWRLWNRETFCCSPESQARSTFPPRVSFPARPKAATTDIPVPALSSSVESAVSDETEETSATRHTTIPEARPELRRTDSSSSSSRGREKHITPIDLEKIVISIKETQQLEPLDLPMPPPSSKAVADPLSTSASQDLSKLHIDSTKQSQTPEDDTTPHPSASQATILESSASTVDTNESSSLQSEKVGSEDSSTTEMSTHSIVRGFVPGGAPSSYRSQTNLAAQPTPILKTSPSYHQAQPKKKGPMFTIGTSSGEEESSLESRFLSKNKKPNTSALSESVKRLSGSAGSRKVTSFNDEVAVGRAAHSPVFESDDEEEEVSESAIEEEEDDSSEWEDSDDQSGPSSINEKELFQRVDSRPNLVSRRSLLTTLMHEPDRAKALANAASRSSPALRRSRTSTPSGPSVATSPEPGLHIPMPVQEMPRSKPIIMTTSNTHQQQLALSPRTTRRNMLSTELTESLRKNLLWERQHRSTGNLAALKRRHTAQDMTKLRQHPEPGPVLSHQDKSNFNNDYFHAGLQEYHAKGW